MLFTSGFRDNSLRAKQASLRRQLSGTIDASRKTSDASKPPSTADIMAERRRRIMRRHTCVDALAASSLLFDEDNREKRLDNCQQGRSENCQQGRSGDRPRDRRFGSASPVRKLSAMGPPRKSSLSPKHQANSGAGEKWSPFRRGRSARERPPSFDHSLARQTLLESVEMDESLSARNNAKQTAAATKRTEEGGPPAMPPPPLPDAWGANPFDAAPRNGPPSFDPGAGGHQNDAADTFDDGEWSSDSDAPQESGEKVDRRRSREVSSTDDERSASVALPRPRSATDHGADADGEHDSGGFGAGGHVSRELSVGRGEISRSGTVKKNINRFSNFVKSGTEAYILNVVKIAGPTTERHDIILGENGAEWAPSENPYSCAVEKPKKETKLKGLKSFVAYHLTPSFTGIQVSRRYKRFDWLQQRLSEKYAFIPIPPLPEKQVSGRYEDEFIEHRMQLLQLWVSKICRHPVLSQSDVWLHFITCTDEKKWKQGKRKAEKDDYSGGNFFLTLQVPAQPLDQTEVEGKIENFSRMTKNLDDSVKAFYTVAHDSAKKMAGHAQGISQAVKTSSDDYYKIGQMFEEQPKLDLEPMMDNLYAYKGMLASVPDILQVHKSALSKLKESERAAAEGKLSQAELDSVRNRVETISYAMLAEINHFQKERVIDFKHMMTHFLQHQVAFYQEIVVQLQDSLNHFTNA